MKTLLLASLCLFTMFARGEDVATEVLFEGSPPETTIEESAGEIVSVGHDTALAEGEKAVSVVAVFGSASSAGEVFDEVVAVLGNTHVTGPVGDSVVAVLGNNYVNSRIGGDVVAVLGDVELGPRADIGGEVVVIGGNLKRNPSAVIHGSVQTVMGWEFIHVDWLRPWIRECLLYGRPLALAPGLGWAWALALGFLALYVALALLFRSGIDRCVETLESQPGRSILAAFLTVLTTPVLFVLLVITVIGIAVVPFLALGVFCAGLFGKATMLAWLGRRLTKFLGDSALAHTAVAVLIGGVIVLALYLVPVLGFIVYKLLGILGLGVVVYTLILSAQRSHGPAGSAAAVGSPPLAQPEVPVSTVAEAATLPRAGFWIRMGALLLDVLLIGIILALFDNPGNLELLLLAAYGMTMWKLKGSTIGGIVCGLKVVRVDGRPVDWPTAIVRALSCFLSLAVAGLGFLWIVFDEGKQAWHDKIAGTAVIRTPKGVSLI